MGGLEVVTFVSGHSVPQDLLRSSKLQRIGFVEALAGLQA